MVECIKLIQLVIDICGYINPLTSPGLKELLPFLIDYFSINNQKFESMFFPKNMIENYSRFISSSSLKIFMDELLFLKLTCNVSKLIFTDKKLVSVQMNTFRKMIPNHLMTLKNSINLSLLTNILQKSINYLKEYNRREREKKIQKRIVACFNKLLMVK